MPDFEPRPSSVDPVLPAFDDSVPEVPPELGQQLQQLFVALEDYMNAPPEATAKIARLCQSTVTEIGSTLRQAHWHRDDALLLLQECLSRLKHVEENEETDARTTWLASQIPGWTVLGFGD
jgi:hypothetical protein